MRLFRDEQVARLQQPLHQRRLEHNAIVRHEKHLNDVRVRRGREFEEPFADEPRRVLDELSKINLVDVVLPTWSLQQKLSAGVEIRKRCVTQQAEHQEILLQHPKLNLPRQILERSRNGFGVMR